MQLVLIIIAAALLGATVGAILTRLRNRYRTNEQPLVAKLLDELPNTQCGQCGYPGCAPYARALAGGEQIDLCPPGGQSLVNRLAELLDRPHQAASGPARWLRHRVAVIHEPDCVGCALCLAACPVDAIVGAARFTHTVIASECTGCELCVAPCPANCIDLIDGAAPPP